MSHRGIPARDIDTFDENSLRGLPSASIGTEPIISLSTVVAIIVVVTIMVIIGNL